MEIGFLIREYRCPIIIGIAQWVITTLAQIDRLFFVYDRITSEMIIVKALYLVVLLIGWSFLWKVCSKLKRNDEYYKRGVFIFFVYLSIMLLMLFILWPGTWAWDDLWTLSRISTYESFDPWQHIITGIYQDVLLQIIPSPVGIIIIQNVVVSACISYIILRLEKTFTLKIIINPLIDLLLKFIPFVLPPILMYQFSGYRLGLYIHIEALLVVVMICNHLDKIRWSWKNIAQIIFLTIIVANWRTESIFYYPIVLVLILFERKEYIANVKKIYCILILTICFLAIREMQKIELGNNDYEIVSIMRPCVELVRAADSVNDADELNAIDKVMDISIIYKYPDANGEFLFYGTNECIRNKNDNPNDDYTAEDYERCVDAFFKLAIKYPKVVIAERFKIFVSAIGLTGDAISNVDTTYSLFDDDNVNYSLSAAQNNANKLVAFNPISSNLRKKCILLLGMRFPNSLMKNCSVRIVWNVLLPLILLIFVWVKQFITRKWYLFLLLLAVIIKIPIIILTEPANWIMYWLTFYYFGYIYLIYGLLAMLSRDKK